MQKVRISDEIKEKIMTRSTRSGLRNPIAGIVEGQWSDENELALYLGFYERDEIPKEDEIEIVDAGGMELLITQRHVLNRLLDGVLTLDDGRIVISTDQ